MSIADKLLTVAQNQQKVYDAGKQAQYGRFWDAYQENGERSNYNSAFRGAGWSDESYNPKYPINIVFNNGSASEATHCFSTSQITDTKVPIKLSSAAATPLYTYFFYYAANLVSVPLLEFDADFVHANSNFQGARNLENITFGGCITQSGLNLSYCTKLTEESLLSLINCLADYSEDTSGTSHTVTLGTANLDKLTDPQKAVATEKGWTLA